jgi:ADP-ribose pyrophosphatase
MIYEIPAGLLEKGESSLRCAKRELLEETGFVARRFSMIGRILTSPGFCTEEISIFLGEGIKKISGFQGDKDEYIKIERIPLGKIVTMIMCGRIKDAKTIVGIFLTRNILKI